MDLSWPTLEHESPGMNLWIPLSWRRGDYISSKGEPLKRSKRALVVTGRMHRVLLGGHPQLVIKATLVTARKSPSRG